MEQGRGTLTDQLTNVIQVIRLGRKSGQLTVERGEGQTLERGKILFEQGRITQAQGGSFSGQQAITWFGTWGACRFLFVSTKSNSQTTKPLSPVKTPRFLGGANSVQHSFAQATFPRDVSHSHPQKICPDHIALNLIEQVGYSRLHRRIFLLINGERNAVELARLVRRGNEEVQQVLLHLEQLRVIRH
ncbi:MAG TPA: DUF4388 domain-containing protein [Ktedonobacteraceae bacterium]|jgi:hypothetical protein